jgi:hypothetical protein
MSALVGPNLKIAHSFRCAGINPELKNIPFAITLYLCALNLSARATGE